MSEVMRFNMFPSGQPNPTSNGLYVRHEDYARLEQECYRIRSLWELELSRATTAENECTTKQWAIDAALAECKRFRAALTEISAMQSHECTIGQNLKDAVRVACDALSTKP